MLTQPDPVPELALGQSTLHLPPASHLPVQKHLVTFSFQSSDAEQEGGLDIVNNNVPFVNMTSEAQFTLSLLCPKTIFEKIFKVTETKTML